VELTSFGNFSLLWGLFCHETSVPASETVCSQCPLYEADTRVLAIQVDDEEDIIVMDGKEKCIKVFDKNGKHLRTFGKSGQGPGEIQSWSRMYLSGGKPMFNSRQENANYAWEKLGKELGFKYMTVRPNGKGDRFFTAEPV